MHNETLEFLAEVYSAAHKKSRMKGIRIDFACQGECRKTCVEVDLHTKAIQAMESFSARVEDTNKNARRAFQQLHDIRACKISKLATNISRGEIQCFNI